MAWQMDVKRIEVAASRLMPEAASVGSADAPALPGSSIQHALDGPAWIRFCDSDDASPVAFASSALLRYI